MHSIVYKRYAYIKKFLNRQYLLSATLEIDSFLTEYIPVVDLKLKKLDSKKMSFGFNTPDQNTKLLSPKKYHNFISYMRIIRQAHLGHILKKGDEKSISYLNCSLNFPIHMEKQSFILNKHRFYILTVLSPQSYTLRFLASPDVDKTWLSRTALKGLTLSRHNLSCFLQLVVHHLVPTIEETDVFSKGYDSTSIAPIVSINVQNKELVIRHELAQSKFDLSDYTASLHTNKSGDVVLYFASNISNAVSLSIVLRPKIDHNILKTIA